MGKGNLTIYTNHEISNDNLSFFDIGSDNLINSTSQILNLPTENPTVTIENSADNHHVIILDDDININEIESDCGDKNINTLRSSKSCLQINKLYYFLTIHCMVLLFAMDLCAGTFLIHGNKLLSRDDGESVSMNETAIMVFSMFLFVRCIFWMYFLIRSYEIRNDVIELNTFIIDHRYKNVFQKTPSIIFRVFTITFLFSGNYFVATYTYIIKKGCIDTELDFCVSLRLTTIMAYINMSLICMWLMILSIASLKRLIKKKTSAAHITMSDLIEKNNSDHTGLVDCCPVCLNTNESFRRMITLKCNHSYHKTCIDSWLEKENTCPVCRSVVVFEKTRILYKRLLEE